MHTTKNVHDTTLGMKREKNNLQKKSNPQEESSKKDTHDGDCYKETHLLPCKSKFEKNIRKKRKLERELWCIHLLLVSGKKEKLLNSFRVKSAAVKNVKRGCGFGLFCLAHSPGRILAWTWSHFCAIIFTQ